MDRIFFAPGGGSAAASGGGVGFYARDQQQLHHRIGEFTSHRRQGEFDLQRLGGRFQQTLSVEQLCQFRFRLLHHRRQIDRRGFQGHRRSDSSSLQGLLLLAGVNFLILGLRQHAPLFWSAPVITCQMAGGRSYRGGSKEDRLRFAQGFADACTKIMGGGSSVVVREVWDEHWVEYGDGDSNHPLNDMDDAQRDLFDAALTQKGLIVEE